LTVANREGQLFHIGFCDAFLIIQKVPVTPFKGAVQELDNSLQYVLLLRKLEIFALSYYY